MSGSSSTLSVKERLALLQDSNAGKNIDLAGPMKTTVKPPLTPKSDSTASHPKPALPALKPVTQEKRPSVDSGSSDIPKWRRKDVSPAEEPANNTDATPSKPALPALKPVTQEKRPSVDSGSSDIPKWRRKDVSSAKEPANNTDAAPSKPAAASSSPPEEQAQGNASRRVSIRERLEALNKSSGSVDGVPVSSVNIFPKAVSPKIDFSGSPTSPVSPKADTTESKATKWPPVSMKRNNESPLGGSQKPVPVLPKTHPKENLTPESSDRGDNSELAPPKSPKMNSNTEKSDAAELQTSKGGQTALTDTGLKPLKPAVGRLKTVFDQDCDAGPGFKGASVIQPKPLKPPPTKPVNDANKSLSEGLGRGPAGKQSGSTASSELIVRQSDGKKFQKVNPALAKISSPPPSKPSRLENVNLTSFVQEYQNELDKLKKEPATNGEAGEEEMDELYDDAASIDIVVRRGGATHPRADRVSAIPEFTEEEEKEEFYDDCTSKPGDEPDENYDDFSEVPQEEYEAVDEINQPKSPPSANDKPKKKEKEKEKDKEKQKEKDKEKATKEKLKDDSNKEEEKERKKKEKEKEMRSKFGLKDTDEKLGDGVVLNNTTGWRKDLKVSKGEIVTILKMCGTPTGKWLVQNAQGKLGYVQASNIEVATPTIRHVMLKYALGVHRTSVDSKQILMVGNEQVASEMSTNIMTGSKDDRFPIQKTPDASDDEPGEVYEALPDEEEGEVEDIYEEL